MAARSSAAKDLTSGARGSGSPPRLCEREGSGRGALQRPTHRPLGNPLAQVPRSESCFAARTRVAPVPSPLSSILPEFLVVAETQVHMRTAHCQRYSWLDVTFEPGRPRAGADEAQERARTCWIEKVNLVCAAMTSS